ncbi:MAG: NAD(P)H-dependent oxidoreductase [Kiritimatiellia bacterium]
MNILHVCADPQPMEDAASKQIAASFFSSIITRNENAKIVNLDLTQEPPAPYTTEEFRNFWYPVLIDGYVPTKEEEAAAEYAEEQAAKVREADILVLTMPMWNYSMPAMMKSWIDHVLAPGLLFEMTAQGNVAKHNVKKLVLLISSHEIFTEADPRDGLTPALENAFADIGIEDVSVIWADGQNPKTHVDFESRKSIALEAAEEVAEEICEDFN